MSASAGGIGVDETEFPEVRRGDRERDRVADRFVEAVIGAIAEEEWKVFVGAHVFVMALLVMNGGEIIRVDVDAHFYAEVLIGVDIPGACVAVDVAIAWANELGALLECSWQRFQTE